MIKINNISMEFKDTTKVNRVLDSISLDIKEGEIISIIGPSGCGKTTFTKILAGYIKPVSGTITTKNKLIDSPGIDRILISQEDDLFPWMTVEENINFFSKNKNQTQNLLKIVNLHKYYNYYPAQISGGMKRRVSLVRALSANPDIIIMDESFSFLDAAIKERLYIEVLKVWRFSKKTIILITHDIEEAILLSSRIIILSSKPSKIKRIINVDLKRPRNFNMKYDQKCVKLRKIIEKYLDNNEY